MTKRTIRQMTLMGLLAGTLLGPALPGEPASGENDSFTIESAPVAEPAPSDTGFDSSEAWEEDSTSDAWETQEAPVSEDEDY